MLEQENQKQRFSYNKTYRRSDFHPIDSIKLYTKHFTIHPENKLIKGYHEAYFIPENHQYKIKVVADTIYFTSEVHKLLHQHPLYEYRDSDFPELFDSIQNIFYDCGIEAYNLQVARIDCFEDRAVNCMSHELQAFSNGLLDFKGNTKVNYKGYCASSNNQNSFVVYDKRAELISKEVKKLNQFNKHMNDLSIPNSDFSLLYRLHLASRMRIREYKSMGKLLRIEYRLLNAGKIKQVFNGNDFVHVMKNLDIIADLRNKTATRMYKPIIRKRYDEIMDESMCISGTIKKKLDLYFIESVKIRFNNDSNKIRAYLKEFFSDWQFKQLWKLCKK